MREIDYEGERIETGPLRIGNDWCGLFIRGDDCFSSAAYLRSLLKELESLPTEKDYDDGFHLKIHIGALRNIISLMESTNEATMSAPAPDVKS